MGGVVICVVPLVSENHKNNALSRENQSPFCATSLNLGKSKNRPRDTAPESDGETHQIQEWARRAVLGSIGQVARKYFWLGSLAEVAFATGPIGRTDAAWCKMVEGG